MIDNRTIYRAIRAQIAEQTLVAELQTAYGEALLGLSWDNPAHAGQGELVIYFAPDTDIVAAHNIVQTHNPVPVLQDQQDRQVKWQNAQQNLPQLINDLTGDWVTDPPPDALEKIRSALLEIAYLVRGRPQS